MQLATYMLCMRDSNLEIRIAGSSCCLQQETCAFCRLSDRLTLGELSRPSVAPFQIKLLFLLFTALPSGQCSPQRSMH